MPNPKKDVSDPILAPVPPKRRGRGRPKIHFDLEQLEQLGVLHCQYDEIAAFFGCSLATIENKMAKDSEFLRAYETGKSKGKATIRRKQLEVARNGNVTMLIWLGKQLVGQIDTGPFNPTFNISATANARADARTPEQVKTHLVELQRAVLAEAQRLNIEAN